MFLAPHIISGWEWFPVFDWRGKPTIHKHLKRCFPLGICMWEGPCVLSSGEMDSEMPWIERSPNFPAEPTCMLIVHITRWKDGCVPCRYPTESPRPPLHLKMGPNMTLTKRKWESFSSRDHMGCTEHSSICSTETDDPLYLRRLSQGISRGS